MMIPESVDNFNPTPGEFNEENVEFEVSETQLLLNSADTDASKTTFSSFSSREWGILVMLASANLLSVVAYSCIAPFYPKEAKTKGLSDFEIGLIFGIYELVIFLGSSIAGKLTPFFGPKNLFTIGLASTGTIALFFGFTDMIPSRRWFFIASLIIRVLQGIGEAAFITSSFTINANTFPNMLSTILASLITS